MGLLGLYRRAVFKSMRRRAGNAGLDQMRRLNDAARGTQSVPQFTTIDDMPLTALTSIARRTFRRARLLLSLTALVYVMAGLGFALVTTLAALSAGHSRINPLRFVTFLWLYAWPAALAVNLVAAHSKRTKVIVVLVYFFGYLVLSVTAVAIRPQLTLSQMLEFWILEDLYPTILLLIFINRRVRAVGPLVFLLMILAVNGAMAAPYFLFSRYTKPLTVLPLQILGASYTFSVTQVFGFAVLGGAGWCALQHVRRRYEEKKLSDQMIVLGAMWLQFAVFWFVELAFEGYIWMLSVVPAIVAYVLISRAGFVLIRSFARSRDEGHKLLVLRVFALRRLRERLFEVVAKCWRHVGSIIQIAGPDLATATVQPHEFLDFMGGKLSRRFIDSPKTFELRLSETDNEADADGRFRVNDFFCYDDTWRYVLDRLIQDSDAVLMDLRGFSSLNSGCIFEIDELLNLVPMERVVLVIDNATDEAFLRSTMTELWRKMCPTSPNRHCERFQLLRFTRNDARNFTALLRALCGAAEATPSTIAP